jgi:hypothetical protein
MKPTGQKNANAQSVLFETKLCVYHDHMKHSDFRLTRPAGGPGLRDKSTNIRIIFL